MKSQIIKSHILSIIDQHTMVGRKQIAEDLTIYGIIV